MVIRTKADALRVIEDALDAAVEREVELAVETFRDKLKTLAARTLAEEGIDRYEVIDLIDDA